MILNEQENENDYIHQLNLYKEELDLLSTHLQEVLQKHQESEEATKEKNQEV